MVMPRQAQKLAMENCCQSFCSVPNANGTVGILVLKPNVMMSSRECKGSQIATYQ